jgi:hypothetical protein
MTNTLLRLDCPRLCKAAQRRTGLKDFGDPPLEPALSCLAQSLEEEADLHPVGRFLMRAHLRGLLENRLRLVDAWKKNPRLGNEQIKRPIFIVGVPRSGSTFLHELLTQNPGCRSPRVWEVMFPIPRRNANDVQPRIRKAEFCLWFFRRLVPKADAVYPMRATTPHECIAIQSHTFLSEEFVATCHVPSYQKFLHGTDLTPAYEWEKRFLQYLQSQSDTAGTRWVLKSPDHVFGLKQLFKVFPDATVIQTHRNPIEVLKSITTLTRVLQGLYSHPIEDPDASLFREAGALADSTERFMRFRDAHPELAHSIIDVRYTDLVEDPVATVRRIFERVDSPMTPAMTQRVHSMASSRTRYRGVRSAARASEPVLDNTLRVSFKQYCSRFDLPFREAA